jgi:hypothetical protein
MGGARRKLLCLLRSLPRTLPYSLSGLSSFSASFLYHLSSAFTSLLGSLARNLPCLLGCLTHALANFPDCLTSFLAKLAYGLARASPYFFDG